MTDISVHNLKKSFEVGSPVLESLSFNIASGERVGILGINGSGKTTLFKLLTGELYPDSGDIVIAKGKRLGLISQIPSFPQGATTEEVLRSAFSELLDMQERINDIARRMETEHTDALLREYDRLSALYASRGGYDTEHELNRVANGLSIDADMRTRPFNMLSGGEKTRVNLARLILEDTDILLLDEPTNHLDLQAVEWLEEYIGRFKGTVLAISHDRYFLDRVVKRCIEIRDGEAELYSGNYSFFIAERQRRFEEQMKKYERDKAKYDQLKAAADKLHLWAFMGNDKLHKRAFSMEKRMEKLAQTERPKTQKKLKADFKELEFLADEAIVAQDLKKGFGDRVLISEFSTIVTGGERIALIGENGTGKSTLLKVLLKEELPDSGYMVTGPSVKTGYLPQIIKFSEPSRSALDTMIYDARCTPQQARDSLGAYGFSGEDALKSVSRLSGGEQSRLRLCMLMREGVNLLILDEPTNHLDINSREWIERAIDDYGQTLVFVSHDRYFIERFATRIWELKDGKITDYMGDYASFLAFKERRRTLESADKRSAPVKKKEKSKGRASDTDKRRRKVERDIEKAEERMELLAAQSEEFATDYEKLMDIENEREALDAELMALYEEWEELSE